MLMENTPPVKSYFFKAIQLTKSVEEFLNRIIRQNYGKMFSLKEFVKSMKREKQGKKNFKINYEYDRENENYYIKSVDFCYFPDLKEVNCLGDFASGPLYNLTLPVFSPPDQPAQRNQVNDDEQTLSREL